MFLASQPRHLWRPRRSVSSGSFGGGGLNRCKAQRLLAGGGHMFRPLRYISIVLAAALLAAACAAPSTPGASGSVAPSAGGAASTLVIDRDTSDLISFDPAGPYVVSAGFATRHLY